MILILLCCLLAACGRVGEPLPPFVRIPEPVRDLAVRQDGLNLVLTWTNPARNIDGSLATDLSRVLLTNNGSTIAALDSAPAGKSQSHSIPIASGIGTPMTLAIQVETFREKKSEVSNIVSITPVGVAGGVINLRGVTDQRRIMLRWEPPKENPQYADAYSVRRADAANEVTVAEPQYDDPAFEIGKTYSYTVAPLRHMGPTSIQGAEPQTFEIQAVDRTPPRTPEGLSIVVSESGAFVTWDPNTERDLAGYRVFRSETMEGSYSVITTQLQTTNGVFDPAHSSGIYYAVSAVDESGNESPRSMPVREQP